MARRVTALGIMVEYVLEDVRRVSTMGVMVEYRDDPDVRRESALGTMVEYYPGELVSLPQNVGGIASEEAVGTPEIVMNRITGYTLCAGEELQVILGVPQVVIAVDPGEKFGPFAPIAERVAGVKAAVIGTRLASLGMTLLVYKPEIVTLTSYNPQGTFIKRLEDQVTGWSHSIDITSGYAQASLSMQTTREDVEDWLEFGLGRHIELHNEAGIVIWEGFVNRVEANLGPLTYNTGALTDIGNIVNVVYTPVDVNVDPPTRGSTTSTVSVANSDSILRYAAIEKTLSAGECTDEDADRYRDTWIATNAWPQPTKDISLGKGDFSMQIELLGYAAWLNLIGYYNDSINFTTLSQKLQDVLASDINGMFSTDYANIEENLYLVPEAEGLSTQRMAWDVVKSLVAIGDVNDARYGFGIYAGRKARYFKIPTDEITYRSRLDDPSQSVFVEDMTGIVRPWNIIPGRWLQYTDLMTGKIAPASLFEDPRAVLIEEVRFDFPWGLQIRGGSASTLAQLVAKMGYNG